LQSVRERFASAREGEEERSEAFRRWRRGKKKIGASIGLERVKQRRKENEKPHASKTSSP